MASDFKAIEKEEEVYVDSAEALAVSRSNEHDEEPDLSFIDGKRRIDYVIAYKEEHYDAIKSFLESYGLEFEKAKRTLDEAKNWVGKYLELGRKHEVDVEPGEMAFLKVHVPDPVMLLYAEILEFKLPVKEDYDINEEKTLWICLRKFINPYELNEELPKPDKFKRTFTQARLTNNEFQTDPEKVIASFTDAQRSRVVQEILESGTYKEERRDESKTVVGIQQKISAAYPLHDQHDQHDQCKLGKRQYLQEVWADPFSCLKKQPLDKIREYLGDKVGLYFAWLGFYTGMLMLPVVVGIIVFLYGFISSFYDQVSKEICNGKDPGVWTMCPICSGMCPYWILSSGCFYAKLTQTFDNGATVFYAAFMSLWATTFCEFWKRREQEINYQWDLFGFEAKQENLLHRSNAANSWVERLRNYRKGLLLVLLFLICLALASVLGIIVYRVVVKAVAAASPNYVVSHQASLIASVTASSLNFLILTVLQIMYKKIALWLTNLQSYNTETEHEDSYTHKMYCFSFVNYYSSSFYIAFIKGKLSGNPANYGKLFGVARMRQEECDAAGCMQELFINIATILSLNVLLQILEMIPWKWWCQCCRGCGASSVQSSDVEAGNSHTSKQWGKDFDLSELGLLGFFDEYLEMVIQFGFVTIFAAAFPLAPLLAIMNNLIEIRADAFKFITKLRRPYAARAQDIGAWYAILLFVGYLAVLTNACVIAFTSECVSIMSYKWTAGNGSYVGYIDSSLAVFNTSNFEIIDNHTTGPDPERYDVSDGYPVKPGSKYYDEYVNKTVDLCRYRGYYTGPNPPYEHTEDYWSILAWKLVFVVTFEHVIFAFKIALAYFIPDIPEHIQKTIKQEKNLQRKALERLATARLRSDCVQGVTAR